ncbi:hypothetical protein, partial [Phocaeicola sp.]|uniref:hypothetical protein n=1 Tax=Phocaeicola sp. TaxID=2773926 RepID=UPI002A7F07C9
VGHFLNVVPGPFSSVSYNLVEDKDDVTHLLVLGDLRFEGFVPHVFLCHNFEFLALIIVVVTANI